MSESSCKGGFVGFLYIIFAVIGLLWSILYLVTIPVTFARLGVVETKIIEEPARVERHLIDLTGSSKLEGGIHVQITNILETDTDQQMVIEVVELFKRMELFGVGFDRQTYISVVNLIGESRNTFKQYVREAEEHILVLHRLCELPFGFKYVAVECQAI